MSAFSPSYAKSPTVSEEKPLPVVHEEVSQNIQGGKANEHYHLTLAELQKLQASSSGTEPVIVNSEFVFADDGDIIVA